MERSWLKAILLISSAFAMVAAEEEPTALLSSFSAFRDCYTKCFIFCIILPSQTLCSCTTNCLKDCIFPDEEGNASGKKQQPDSLAFCKIGCAFTACSRFSSERNPNGDKVDDCVGTCSQNCNKSFS